MKIYEVPDSRRYWVVRADGGLYYDHFTRHGVIALGHFNKLEIQIKDTGSFTPDEGWIKDSVASKARLLESTKRQESVSLNQLKNFIYDIKNGDWVITVGYNALRFGIVEGSPYIDNKPLEIIYDPENNRKVEMDYILRRRVSWGPVISRSSIPFGLLSSLRANQTLFNVDKHWEAIHHSLYPAFSKNDELYLSLKIRSENEISNYSVVQILSFLNEIELISKELEGQLNLENFESLFDIYASQGLFSLTTKAQFNSPGDIWNKINFTGIKSGMVYALIAYAMIFGNDQMGMDGIIDLQTRQKLWDIVVKRLEEKHMHSTVNSLELSKPNYNTSILESMDMGQNLTSADSRTR